MPKTIKTVLFVAAIPVVLFFVFVLIFATCTKAPATF
jgi:hypothetical protein